MSTKGTPIQHRPIPDQSTWNVLLQAYKQVKKHKDGSFDDEDQALFDAIAQHPSGIHIPYQIQQIQNKGRGVVCTLDVPKGTTICDDRTGYFETQVQLRSFLNLLPPELAHECLDWMGVDDYREGEAVCLDFCDMSCLNHGCSDRLSVRETIQLWFLPRRRRPKLLQRANIKSQFFDGRWHLETTRNIASGEELLVDYRECSNYHHGLPWFTSIYDQHYPDTPHHTELERWSK